MKKYIILSSFFIVLFTACSTKEVYTPKLLGDDWNKLEAYDQEILDTSSNVALLEDNKIITKTGIIDYDLNASYRLISQSDGWIISSSIDGDLILTAQDDQKKREIFKLKKTIASASVHGDDLAVLFADNEMAIYDIQSKAVLFKEQGSKYLAADSRIVNPYFLRDLVLFATLDGKVVIVNKKQKKKLRTVIASSEDAFNNILSLNVIENKIIAATTYKILSMSKKEVRAKYEVRNIAYDEKNVYVATKQGEVLSLNPSLEVNFKVKFPFAHFYGMISNGDKLYVLEKEGYIIVLDKDSFAYSVHEVDFDDGFIFTSEKIFYANKKKILTE